MLAGRLVAVANSSQGHWVIGPFGPGQPDDLVGGDAQTAVDLVTLDDLVVGV